MVGHSATARDRGDDPAWDAAEAAAVYSLLEGEVIPTFYDRGEGIPSEWVTRIRESMARLTPMFSANRAVRQYTDELYFPLASAYIARARNHGAAAAELIAWQRELAARWRNVGFGRVKISTHDGRHCFHVEVRLGGVRPDDVQVELYADAVDSDVPYRSAMLPCGAVEDGLLYTGSAPASRPADHYTPRVIPRHEGAFIPAENALIAWQK